MILTLDRYQSPGKGVFGILGVGNRRLYTCENMWMGNVPFISCVPSGWYKMVRYSSPKFPDTWALVNPDLRVYKHLTDRPDWDDTARFACVFHTGNTTTDTQGCILPGTGLGFVNNQWAVTSSRTAMNLIRDKLGNDDHAINIRWKEHE